MAPGARLVLRDIVDRWNGDTQLSRDFADWGAFLAHDGRLIAHRFGDLSTRAVGAREEFKETTGELVLGKAGDFALEQAFAVGVLILPGLDSEVAGLGEGGADVGVLRVEG